MASPVSIGDVLAITRFILDSIAHLRGSSSTGYRDLELELHGLQCALNELEHIECLPQQRPQTDRLRVAALSCKHVLDEFAGKMAAFQALQPRASIENSRAGASATWLRVKGAAARLRWGFTMDREVETLRAKLNAHVAYLNMRLLVRSQQMTPWPDTRFTYLQAPVCLEDAFGQLHPVPSEYSGEVCLAMLFRVR